MAATDWMGIRSGRLGGHGGYVHGAGAISVVAGNTMLPGTAILTTPGNTILPGNTMLPGTAKIGTATMAGVGRRLAAVTCSVAD